jgi:group I intron endonuclease
MAYIYCATNRVNGKRYVGFTTNLRKRKNTHKSAATCGSPYVFHKAIRKYGFEQFDFGILFEHVDAKYVLNQVEPFLIALIRPEYNVTKGGEGVLKDRLSEEHRQKLRDNHADMSGENNPFYGKTHSIESRRRMSAAQKGNSKNKGRVFSDETRQKMSEAAKRRFQSSVHPRLGTTHSEEAKMKMRKPKRTSLNRRDHAVI